MLFLLSKIRSFTVLHTLPQHLDLRTPLSVVTGVHQETLLWPRLCFVFSNPIAWVDGSETSKHCCGLGNSSFAGGAGIDRNESFGEYESGLHG